MDFKFLEVEPVSHTNLTNKIGFPFNNLSNNITNAGFGLLWLNDTFDDICISFSKKFDITESKHEENCVRRFNVLIIPGDDNINITAVIIDNKTKTIEFINNTEIEVIKNDKVPQDFLKEFISNCLKDCIAPSFIYIYHRLENPDWTPKMIITNLNKKIEEFDKIHYPSDYKTSFSEILYKYRQDKIKDYPNWNDSYVSHIMGEDSLSVLGVDKLIKKINLDKLNKTNIEKFNKDTKYDYIDQIDQSKFLEKDKQLIEERNKLVKQLRFEKIPEKRKKLELKKMLTDVKLRMENENDIHLSPIVETKESNYVPNGILLHTSIKYITEKRDNVCEIKINLDTINQKVSIYKFNTCLNNEKIRFMVGIVGIVVNSGHANAIFIDKTNKKIELFEPHGSDFEFELINTINELLQKAFSTLLPDYTFVPSTTICPFLGPQSKSKDKYCLTWSMLYLKYRLKYPEMNPTILLHSLDEKIVKISSRTKFIENFGEKLVQYKDKYLKEKNFSTWDNWNMGFIFGNGLTTLSMFEFFKNTEYMNDVKVLNLKEDA